jgi:hypothetical protein
MRAREAGRLDGPTPSAGYPRAAEENAPAHHRSTMRSLPPYTSEIREVLSTQFACSLFSISVSCVIR